MRVEQAGFGLGYVFKSIIRGLVQFIMKTLIGEAASSSQEEGGTWTGGSPEASAASYFMEIGGL